MKFIAIIFTILFITSCASTRVEKQDTSIPLANNEGYLGIVINSLDNLMNMEMQNTEEYTPFYIGGVKKGVTLVLLRVNEGEYCFKGFDVYNLRVDYVDSGFCTYVEAGELNYFGELLVRDPVSTHIQNFDRFTALLQAEYPELCREYIGESC